MRRLILFRHGKALVETSAGDHARALSKRGRAEAGEAGAALQDRIVPELALVSDSRRTRETFDRIAARIEPQAIPSRVEPRLYGADPNTILELVAEVPASVQNLLVVGHNPGIGELARALAVAGEHAARHALAAHFPTSAFAILALEAEDWAGIGRGGTLESFVTVGSSHASN